MLFQVKWRNRTFSYSYLNTSAFEIGYASREMMLNTFTIACKIGYRFFAGTGGACSGSLLNINADYSQFPVLIEQSDPSGLLITNGQFVAGDAVHNESTVTISPTHKGVVQFMNSAFWGPARHIADISGGDESFPAVQLRAIRMGDAYRPGDHPARRQSLRAGMHLP